MEKSTEAETTIRPRFFRTSIRSTDRIKQNLLRKILSRGDFMSDNNEEKVPLECPPRENKSISEPIQNGEEVILEAPRE